MIRMICQREYSSEMLLFHLIIQLMKGNIVFISVLHISCHLLAPSGALPIGKTLEYFFVHPTVSGIIVALNCYNIINVQGIYTIHITTNKKQMQQKTSNAVEVPIEM